MINDTMIRYTPETGYPVTEVRRRRRIVASSGERPRDPRLLRLVRWALYAVAGVLFAAAIAWLALGAAGHVRSVLAADRADSAIAELDQQWAADTTDPGVAAAADPVLLAASSAPAFAPSSTPALGAVWGKLQVPSLGLTDVPLLEGTESQQIDVGVGHYVDTAFPWEGGGNLGLAGHRTGWAELFHRLDELDPGDRVYVETEDAFFEYTVTGSDVVPPTGTWVLSDDPGPATGATGQSQLLTLTTCDGPENEKRLVVWGELTRVLDKSAGATLAALA